MIILQVSGIKINDFILTYLTPPILKLKTLIGIINKTETNFFLTTWWISFMDVQIMFYFEKFN